MSHLEKAAARFSARGCAHYLSEALQCLVETGDPIEALALLHGMWGSGYAARSEQKEALNAVGQWLEERLNRDPKASSDGIALEIGWLRRLSRYEVERIARRENPGRNDQRHARRDEAPGRGVRREPEQKLRFGDHINGIRQRRLASAVPVAAAAKPVARVAPPPPRPPDRLPDVFEVEFTDFSKARDARRNARERAQRNKPPKHRLVDLQPVDARLRALARGLVCAIPATPGLEDLFAAIDAQAGVPRSFFLTRADIEQTEGKAIARRILLSLPETPAQG